MDFNQFRNHQHLHYVYNSDNVPMRIDDHQLSSLSEAVPHQRVSTSGLLRIPLQSTHVHQPIEINSSSGNQAQYGAYSYHGHAIHVGESSSASTNTIGQSAAYKRTIPDTSTAYEAEKRNIYFTQTNSSVFPASSGQFHHNMVGGSVRQPCGSYSIPVNQGNGFGVVERGWQRNVRSRHDVHVPNGNSSGRHLSYNHSRSLSAQDITARWELSGINASYNPYRPNQFQQTGYINGQERVRHQIYDFNMGNFLSATAALGHEMSQPFFQNGSSSGFIMGVGSHGNVVPSRNQNDPLRIFHNSSAHIESRHRLYDQRNVQTVPDRTAWTPMTSSEAGMHFASESFLRNSVPVPDRGPPNIGGIGSRRSYGQTTSRRSSSVAMMSSEERMQTRSESFFRNPRQRPARGSRNSEMRGWSGNSSRGLFLPPAFGNGRGISEVLLGLSHSSLYDHLSSFDEHADMRLDVDTMSYEELLALGERIGNVEAGLSEDMVSTLLKEITYASSLDRGQDKETEKCAICLENYEDKEKIGILQCCHDYHFSCIKDWLLRKTTCPICKRSVTEK